MDSFHDYLLANHTEDLYKILVSEDHFNNYSVNIDFIKLFEEDPILGDGILCNPKNEIPKCSRTIIDAQKSVIGNEEINELSKPMLKTNVHARFFGLPVCPELNRITVPKNKDLNCFLRITGTAIRLTQAKMLEYRRNYKCSKCNHVQLVEGKYEHRYIIKAPTSCANPIQCRSTTMVQIHDVTRDNCKDYQEMKIQEQINKLAVGGIPGSIWVTLEDDLVDCCKPGDDVSICGTVLRRWRPTVPNKKSDVELVVKANHIQICNLQKSSVVAVAPDLKVDFEEFWEAYEKCPMKGREIILASVCPKVYGLYMVKLALILTVITGCSHSLEVDNLIMNKTISPKASTNHSVRGQCHLLLVGDPGTGKSQLLKAGALLTSRSVLTSGSGSTKAGLTCTALREDGEWQLEAGALVLADGGACCIDELAQMREHDRASIHEAMEQQTISVAKAGIICKLNTRCAVIAACNPKGNYDTEQPLSVNVSLGTPLLSRFDLIFILLDTKNKNWDSLVAEYILFGENSETLTAEIWPIEKLQVYLSLIGPYEVSMTTSAINILQAYYVSQRKAENRDPSRTTVRMLDSLVRLSQAHAKLMHRNKVFIMDAITAVCLMDLSMQDCTLTGTSDALQTNFSKFPDLQYLKTAKQVLVNLKLDEIWQIELLFYARLLNVDKNHLLLDIDNENTSLFSQFDIANSSTINDSTENVIESTYFRDGDKKNSEKVEEVNKKTLFDSAIEIDEDEIDKILDFDCSKINNYKKNNDYDETEPGSSKFSTAELLAKSLKKHSMLNNNLKMHHVGVITGKQTRKRKLNKTGNLNVKDLQKEKEKVPVKRKRKDKQCEPFQRKKACKKGKNELNVNSDNDPSSNDEIDERQILKCLPSVNDVFDDLKIDFTMIDNDSDTLFECSQKETSIMEEDKNNHTPPKMLNETNKENHNSTLNNKTIKKLESFICIDRRKKEENVEIGMNTTIDNKPNEILPNEISRTLIPHEDINKISNQKSISYNSSDSIRLDSVATSQRSIFENDDYDDLQL